MILPRQTGSRRPGTSPPPRRRDKGSRKPTSARLRPVPGRGNSCQREEADGSRRMEAGRGAGRRRRGREAAVSGGEGRVWARRERGGARAAGLWPHGGTGPGICRDGPSPAAFRPGAQRPKTRRGAELGTGHWGKEAVRLEWGLGVPSDRGAEQPGCPAAAAGTEGSAVSRPQPGPAPPQPRRGGVSEATAARVQPSAFSGFRDSA